MKNAYVRRPREITLPILVLARGNQPAIVLNFSASQAEGAEWDPLFLRVAEVIR